ncbi:hypothetical protein BVIET440_10316 [Burkholderia vietnamiensis]
MSIRRTDRDSGRFAWLWHLRDGRGRRLPFAVVSRREAVRARACRSRQSPCAHVGHTARGCSSVATMAY